MTDNLGTVRDMAVYDLDQRLDLIANAPGSTVRSVSLVVRRNLGDRHRAAVDCLFGFTGCPFDTATGLQNNDNRWYDPLDDAG